MRKILPNLLKITITLLIFGSFVYHYTFRLDSAPFHPDEHDFVGRAAYFDLFIKRDFSNKEWQDFGVYDQPPLAYYVYGLTLHLFGYKDIAKEQERIGYNLVPDENGVLEICNNKIWWVCQQGREISPEQFKLLPSFEMISKARITAVVFSLGCLILVFFVASKLGGWFTGVISMTFFGLNSLLFGMGRNATTDSILLFFLLATTLVIIYGANKYRLKNIGKFLIFTLLVGVLAALAASTKLNGGMVLIFWFLVLFILASGNFSKEKRQWLLAASGFLISLIVFFNVFVFLNPYLYPDPIGGAINMIKHRINTSNGQQGIFPKDALFTFPQRFNSVFKRTLTGNGGYNNFKIQGLDLFLFLSGLLLMLISGKNKYKKKKFPEEFVVFIWTILTFACVIAYIPLDWDRYYLPLIPCIAIVQAYAVVGIGRFIGLRLIRSEFLKNYKIFHW